VHTGFWCGNLKERDSLENLGVDGMLILKHLKEKGWNGINWIDLAQVRDKWRALMNTVMNTGDP
jgi:hypothetical protein